MENGKQNELINCRKIRKIIHDKLQKKNGR